MHVYMKYIYIYVIYLYMYIYICVCVCVCVLFKEKTMNILIKNISAAAFINSFHHLQFKIYI